MDATGRAQSLAGIVTIAALPLLYIGGTQQVTILVVIGLVLFTAAMTITPAMHFLITLRRGRDAHG
ncbi:hypothetical protein [Nocardiopsis oceani]